MLDVPTKVLPLSVFERQQFLSRKKLLKPDCFGDSFSSFSFLFFFLFFFSTTWMSVQRTRLALILYDYSFEERRRGFTEWSIRFVPVKLRPFAVGFSFSFFFFWKFFSSWRTLRDFHCRSISSNLSNAATRTDDHRMIGDHCAINDSTTRFFIHVEV